MTTDTPFLEHPDGEHDDALAAMADAITRLRTLANWNRWATFHASGQGVGGVDSYHFAAIKMLGDRLAPVGVQVDFVKALREVALAADVEVTASPEEGVVVRGATSLQLALLLDRIFRGQMGIRPHDDEEDDYAVGVEWA